MSFSAAVFSIREHRPDSGGTFVTGEQTSGAVGIFEGVIPPGQGVHWHTHTREMECFYVVEGRFRFWCGTETRDGGPGTVVVAPPHLRHRWENISTVPARLLMWVTPGGFERFFSELDALSDPTPQAIFEIETRYGIISEILG